MRRHDNIDESLLDRDGSNVNFERPTWEGVQALIESLEASFGKTTGNGGERRLDRPWAASVLSVARDYWFVQDDNDPEPGKLTSGFAHLVLEEGRGLFKRLQVFVASEDDRSPFVEMSFWPEDLQVTNDLSLEFIRWVNNICRMLRARRCYARDASASWNFGDTAPDSGVFFVSDAQFC